jgi:hypothetical protein
LFLTYFSKKIFGRFKIISYICNVKQKTRRTMKRITSLGNDYRVETFDLSEEQHDIAVEMVKGNQRKNGSYTLEEVDSEMVNVWIADAHSEGETEYAEFLREALASRADLYTLTDHLGDFSQPIGEVAIYD